MTQFLDASRCIKGQVQIINKENQHYFEMNLKILNATINITRGVYSFFVFSSSALPQINR